MVDQASWVSRIQADSKFEAARVVLRSEIKRAVKEEHQGQPTNGCKEDNYITS